jgi:hypothetical protein
MYIAGEPLNERDGLFNAIDPAARAAVTVALESGDALEPGAMQGRFDIIVAFS